MKEGKSNSIRKDEPIGYTQVTLEKFKKVADQCNGIITPMAQLLGVTRKCIYDWMRLYPDYNEAVLDARDITLDIIEQKHLSYAIGNDTPQAVRAREFFLTKLGGHRGYGDTISMDVTTKGESLKYSDLSDAELNAKIRKYSGSSDIDEEEEE